MGEIDQTETYEWLRMIFNGNKKAPLDIAQLKSRIEERAKENNTDYVPFIGQCLSILKNFDDQQFLEHLLNLFYENLEADKPLLIPYYNMVLAGLVDVLYYDIHKAIERSPKLKDPSLFDLKLMYELFYRSKLNTPILIIGETGTSKGLLARAIHKMGNRRNEKYEELNCAAIPKDLFESELFGHIKGSFTGAFQDKDGILKIANKGTVFLDEIGKAYPENHAKLLKVIEEKKIRPVGGNKTIDIDVRFITAARPEDIKEILPDLLYRLGFPNYIEMPTLNERLKMYRYSYFTVIKNSLKEALRKMGVKENITISQRAFRKLIDHKYKGHYRELENILSSAVIKAQMDHRDFIDPQDLEDVMNLSKKYYENKEIESLEHEKPKLLLEDTPALESVKLRDIIDHANKKRASLIEAKVKEALKSRGNLRSILMSEGLTKKEYINFRKKIVTITGKKIKEFRQ